MSKDTIKKKRLGQYEYSLVYFAGDGQYVIYKDDEMIRFIHRIPEILVTSDREEALRYFDALK